ncbi:MAG: anti-sigma factor antagonist [Sphingobacteriia bacterium]|nr:anti-sigma factor antagonist [Sphingobacteriia bacterium]NCC40505.1 anti-sigma factor antagonist [Gammaproteobacteria bacterium]
MNLAHRTENGIDIVKLPRQLGMADAADARAALKDIINGGGGRMIIDLSDTEIVDSSGLAVLVGSLQAARKKDGDLYLTGMGNTVRALFELTRLHTVFQIFDDESAALRAWAEA